MSFFGKAKQDKTSILTAGHDISVDPIFLLFLDALNQLVSMNPLHFEFKTSYLVFIASELYTNRFWEFLQSGKENSTAALPSVFSQEFRLSHKSKVFTLKDGLQYSFRHIKFWSEFFLRHGPPATTNDYSKDQSLESIQHEAKLLIQQIDPNLLDSELLQELR